MFQKVYPPKLWQTCFFLWWLFLIVASLVGLGQWGVVFLARLTLLARDKAEQWELEPRSNRLC